jgi:hypothetical protein
VVFGVGSGDGEQHVHPGGGGPEVVGGQRVGEGVGGVGVGADLVCLVAEPVEEVLQAAAGRQVAGGPGVGAVVEPCDEGGGEVGG